MSENDKFWEEYKQESFDAIRAIIDRVETKLNHYSGKEAFEYLKPIRYLLWEAELQLDHEKDKRINDADSIINKL